ncbi:MAG: ABC transporter permease [Gaiellaceae bacterium]
MTALIRGELIKTVSTRTALGYLAIGAALAIVNVVIVSQFSVLDTVSDKRDALAGLPILLLLFGLVGAAGEYRHGTAAPAALMARRGRGWLLVARAGAYAATGLAIAAVMVAVSLAVGLPLVANEPGPKLPVSDIALVAGGSLVAAALSATVGVAVGALVRNQVASVVGALILAFLGMELLAAVNEDAVGFTPFGAAAILAGDPGGGTFSLGAAALVMAIWTTPLLIAAIAAERRRDLA